MKILFADNSLWAQLNFRGSIITHLRDVGHEVVMVSPIDAQSQEIVIPDRIRHIAIEMRRTSTNPLHDILYFFRLMSIYWKERPEYIRYVGSALIEYSLYGYGSGTGLYFLAYRFG